MISVIIPVYNASVFLEKCVRSVLNQNYAQLEVILVDDGSKDNSLAVCQNLASNDSRIHVIHQENSGVSAARNTGLAHATGEYVSFVDADDYLTADYFQHLLKNAEDHNADIVCCDFIEILNDQEVQISLQKVRTSRVVPDLYSLFYDSVEGQETYSTCVWGKLIRTGLAKKVSFKTLRFGEDQVYMFDLFCTGPRVYLDTYKGYYYVRNESSATMKSGSLSIARTIDEMSMQQYKAEHLPGEASSLYPRYYDKYAMSVHGYARAVVISGNVQERKEHRKQLCSIIDQILKKSDLLSRRTKIYLAMYRYCPWLYRTLLLVKAPKETLG